MSTRSLNKVLLIGNLTRDPELRYTPQGTAVVTFGLATNRSWTTESGERREETEFHRIVAWNKLAELCAQLLFKGRRVYVEGRLSTRRFVGADGQERQITEIVIDDMLLLDSRRQGVEEGAEGYIEATETAAPAVVSTEVQAAPEETAPSVVTEPAVVMGTASTGDTATDATAKTAKGKKAKKTDEPEAGLKPEDIPF